MHTAMEDMVWTADASADEIDWMVRQMAARRNYFLFLHDDDADFREY